MATGRPRAGGFGARRRAALAARTSQVLTDTLPSAAACSISVLSASDSRSEIRAVASPSSAGPTGSCAVGRVATETRRSSPSKVTRTDGVARDLGLGEGSGDLVCRGGDRGHECQPHGRVGGAGEAARNLLGAFVAKCRGGMKLVVDALGVFRKLHDVTMTSL